MKKILLAIVLSFFCSIGYSQDVIDPVLQNVLMEKDNEMIEINIIFKSQFDIEKLKARGENISDKKIRRNVLIDELKLFSEERQHDVLSVLNAEKNSSRVTDIKCHWLSNAISCVAHRNVIYLLAKHPDIDIIGYDDMKQWTMAEEQVMTDVECTDNISMVNADKVWDLGYTGKGVLVAIIDSGVNYNHVDLADHLWDGGAQYPNHGYNVIDGNNDPMDHFGHGTHCAGTICGDGTSGVATGMAPDATLMCIKALDNYGYGSTSAFNTGMEFAIEHQADIISMSLGVMNASAADKTLMRNTCVNALQLGVVAAVAVGNDKNMMMVPVPYNVRTPGSCPPPWLHPDQQVNAGALSCVVAVGAIDVNEVPYENGSMGPVLWTDTEFNDYPYNPNIGLIRPDICAPGVSIKSLSHSSNDGFCLKSGTSMATPCVAGVMALLLEKQNDLSPADICMILETTAKSYEETKSNVTGSGLIDAFKAVTNIQKGDVRFNGFVINDENENDNANLNAGETVMMSMEFYNDSDETWNDVKVVISCDNENVVIVDGEAEVNSLAADENVALVDEFEFSVDENVECNTPLLFDVNFYDNNENVISSLCFLVYVSGNSLEFASFVVKNDDNGNGILESGETADLGVVINNIGNEIAVKVDGILTSSSDIITINQNEADFNSVGGESSSVAFFNVKVADNAGDNIDIPFEIHVSDINGNENDFVATYSNACDYTFELDDYYNDGWDGAALVVKYDNGDPDDILTIESGGYETYTLTINSNVEVSLEWKAGIWDAECSFIVMNEKGEVIYKSPEFPNSRDAFLYSWVNDCSCENEYVSMCDAVEDLNGTQDQESIVVNWTGGGQQPDVVYEVYRGTRFLGTTSETTFVDHTLDESGDYIYNVRMMADDCNGLFQNVSVNYNHVSVKENDAVKAVVYPNPSQDDFIVECDGMRKVTVYNVIGNKLYEKDSVGDRCVIVGLDAGVYFIEIENDEGNAVKKILKL